MNLLSRVIRLPLRLVPSGREIRILTGELRGWKWITGSATHGTWLGTYERESQQAFKLAVHEGDIVYDIGANVGFFTLLAAKLVGRSGAVYAFEPLRRNIEYLNRHIVANNLTTVHVLPIAVSSRKGVAQFTSADSPSMGRLTPGGDVEVETESLDELVGSGRVPAPHFIKIDVEGAEYDVLNGAASVLRRHRPAMLLSLHGYREYERCCALVRALSYELSMIRDGSADGQYTVLATFTG